MVAGWATVVLGTARWEDVPGWDGVCTGDAWGGGIAAAGAELGAPCAAELSIGAPPGGGRAASPEEGCA